MRTKALLVGLAAATGGLTMAQAADPPAPPVGMGLKVEQDELDPANVPLVAVIDSCEGRDAIMGVVIGAGQVLLSPGEMWTPGARVRCPRTGAEAPVLRVLNWGGVRDIEWAVVEVEWPDGAEPAPVRVAKKDAATGAALRGLVWHHGEYTLLRRRTEFAFCPTCTHHLPVTAEDEPYEKHHLGAPLLNEHGELVGLLRGVGFRFGLGLLSGGPYQGLVSRSRWQAEAIEPVTEERFSEVLRDHKAARTALATAGEAFRNSQWPEALAGAREAIAVDPNFGRAWLMLGYVAYQLEDYRIAATALKNALRRDEEPAQATGVLANAVALLGDRDQAVQLAVQIEEAWPDDARALEAAAIALTTVRRDDDAKRLLRRVLELNPGDERALRMLRELDVFETG